MNRGRDHAAWLPLLLLAGALAGSGVLGCATYSDKLQAAHAQVTAGNYEGGISEIDSFLKVDGPDELPDKFGSDNALAVLERGTLQQAVGDYERSARDFGVADEELQYLDLAGDVSGQIGRYVYSDSATVYQASPVEKLSLNGFNMLNYLALGDLNGARVEARRFTVMRDYLREFRPDEAHGSFGSYVAGFVFERLGEVESAVRYYDEALADRPYESLRAPLAGLLPRAAYRGRNIPAFVASGPTPSAPPADAAEILTVVSMGRVPYKVPTRIPVGAAVGIAGSWIVGDPKVLGYSAFKVVVYPDLAPSGSVVTGANLRIDGRAARLDLATDLGGEIRREYERIKPQILGAALSRMIVRAGAAEAARQAGRQQGSELGWFLALFTEAALVALDKPDTRSWSFLPGAVYLSRQVVQPGTHELEVELVGGGGETQAFDVEVPPGRYVVVVVTAPR